MTTKIDAVSCFKPLNSIELQSRTEINGRPIKMKLRGMKAKVADALHLHCPKTECTNGGESG